MMSDRVWIFDLDDTLHNASAHIFPHLNRAMTQYIMDSLTLDEPAAQQLRQRYWLRYGATLKGLVRHHAIDPRHFLRETHAFDDLPGMVVHTRGLQHLLKCLPGRKVVFTNAPREYALRVLQYLKIQDIFELVFSVESTGFHPKPALRGFRRLLRKVDVNPYRCVMVEDNLPALMTAKRLGMQTVHVSRQLHKPSYVDWRIANVMDLQRIQLRT